MPKTTEKTVKSKSPLRQKGAATKRIRKGIKVERFFTKAGEDPFETTLYELRSSKIANADGSVVFEMNDIEVPRNWTRLASDILISKYLRKSQVPQYDKYGKAILDKDGKPKLGAEQSVKQMIKRLAYGWRWWGEKFRYFTSRADADRFEDELSYMLLHQLGAPNSPQWFNTGLALRYAITGPAQGHWYADPKTGKLKQSEDAYTRPQPHACFIQSIKDDLVNSGGIFDLAIKEARIFKYGSGNGTNFSSLRGEGEPLSGGGKSSGLMSWLKIFDTGAGAIKSGGTTRRASKMVIVNVDHPDVEKFIEWKYKEEEKAAALIAAGYSSGIEGQAYQTVSGQNANNSVRVTDDFMNAVEKDKDWHLRWRTKPEQISNTIKAKKLWEKIADAAWHCGDPGVQFDTNVNNWHTCLASGRINASNPCSEFMFLDDSACNLASLNLVKFYDEKSGQFDIEAFKHAVRLWTVVLEVSVLMAQFPSYDIAKNSYLYRPLGLGYANLGTLLMIMGKPYDSDQGRGTAAAITSLMTAISYATSAEMARQIKPFEQYEKNKADMLRIIRNHRRAAYNAKKDEYENLNIKPFIVEEKYQVEPILKAAREAWDKALLDGGQFGFRNAQVTLLAPTGTIGLVMDCDTTGVEPDYALVKFKKLAGGGSFKIINQSVPRALKNLKYKEEQTEKIIKYVIGTGSLENAPHINRASLLQKGLSDEEINLIESRLPGSFDINQTFNSPDITSADNLVKWNIVKANPASADFSLLSELGFSKEQISEANRVICGTMTVEGAPYLKEEDLAIFDCANKCGEYGKRFISAEGHIKMMAAVQPFLSGAISKTVNLPNEATKQQIEKVYMDSWKLGLKAIAIYRDGSKVSQPLTSKESKTKEQVSETIVEYKPVRQRMPKERMSITRKVTIGGHKMYFTVGLYNDGRPGELFIVMNQQGSFAAGMADSFAKMVSIGLQYGVPIETIISQLKHMRFQPMGYTGDPDVQSASSISDYIAQWFQKKFLEDKTKAVELPFEKEKESDENGHEAEQLFLKQAQSEPPGNLGDLNARLGFSGEMCPECGSASMVINGKCQKCLNCGATTGCS